MARTALKVFLLDILLLLSVVFVIQDLQWRVQCAAAAEFRCTGHAPYSSSFSYNVLTQFFTMGGSSVQLTSPPTLDWVQILIIALVVVNIWYLLSWRHKKRIRLPNPETQLA